VHLRICEPIPSVRCPVGPMVRSHSAMVRAAVPVSRLQCSWSERFQSQQQSHWGQCSAVHLKIEAFRCTAYNGWGGRSPMSPTHRSYGSATRISIAVLRLAHRHFGRELSSSGLAQQTYIPVQLEGTGFIV